LYKEEDTGIFKLPEGALNLLEIDDIYFKDGPKFVE
jgi:hypothetical protein